MATFEVPYKNTLNPRRYVWWRVERDGWVGYVRKKPLQAKKLSEMGWDVYYESVDEPPKVTEQKEILGQ